ncbi:MAG: hypothetical protein IH599_02540, partial [Bacteroidales bacterium]|nr:hypothetical protein [Bacteroidales bacterium]
LVIDTVTGCSARDTITFYEETPFAAFGGKDTILCRGKSVDLGMPDTLTGAVYSWFPSYGLDDPTSSQPQATPLVSTTYVLFVSGNNYQGCDDYDSVHVEVYGSWMSVDAGPDMEICEGEDVVLSVPCQPGFLYHWEPENWLSNPDSCVVTAEEVDEAVTFTVTIRDTANCSYGTDQVNVSLFDVPQCYDDWENNGQYDEICPGGTVTLGCDSIPGAIYVWSPAAGLDNPFAAQPIASPDSSVCYELVMEWCGGIYWFESCIDVLQIPQANAGLDTAFCADPVEIGMAEEPGTSYSWQPTTGLSDPNSSFTEAYPSLPTQYILTASNHCGTEKDTILVTPVIPHAQGYDAEICKGASVQIGIAASPGLVYEWDPDPGLSSYSKSMV